VNTTDWVLDEILFRARCVLLAEDDDDGTKILNEAGATAALCEDDPPLALALALAAGAGALFDVPGATEPPPPPPPQATTLSPAMMPSAITLERLNMTKPR